MAVACAVQNLHLSATAAGLAGMWSTPPLVYSGCDQAGASSAGDERCLGFFFLGWPAIRPPRRTPPLAARKQNALAQQLISRFPLPHRGFAHLAIPAARSRESNEPLHAARPPRARKGVGLTSPNPPVGAVAVRSGKVLGKGWHRRAGGLTRKSRRSRRPGSRLPCAAARFITLEPCSTDGRTPPCVEALVKRGDRARGLGDGRSESVSSPAGRRNGWAKSGTGVTRGSAGRRPQFAGAVDEIHHHRSAVGDRQGRVELDGKITRPEGESRWLTREASRADAMKLRRRADAIIIGAETLRRDDPALTVRPAVRGKSPAVACRAHDLGRLPRPRLFTDELHERTLVFKTARWTRTLRDLGRRGVVSCAHRRRRHHARARLRPGLVDQVCFYFAPLIAGSGRPVIDPEYFSAKSVALRD